MRPDAQAAPKRFFLLPVGHETIRRSVDMTDFLLSLLWGSSSEGENLILLLLCLLSALNLTSAPQMSPWMMITGMSTV